MSETGEEPRARAGEARPAAGKRSAGMAGGKRPAGRAGAAAVNTGKGSGAGSASRGSARSDRSASAAPRGQTAAQKRLAAQRAVAAASGARSARRGRLLKVLTPVLVVAAVVIVLVVVKAVTSDRTKAQVATPAPAQLVSQVTTVPAAVLNEVGAGSSTATPKPASGAAPLTANGLPRVLFVGAEWCPFCAAERWALTVALSRFGSFTGLQQTRSSSTDVHPNTATLSYYGAKYASKYLVFSGNEVENGAQHALVKLSAADQQLFVANTRGNFPFADIGGAWVITNAEYDAGVLAGKTQEQIATALNDPTSAIAKGVLGAANVITAAVCTQTKQQPAAVCGSAGVRAGAAALNGSGSG